MRNTMSDKENSIVSRVSEIKSLDRKRNTTSLSNITLESSDIYTEVREIPFPKDKFFRAGENGVNVPQKYFPTKISYLNSNVSTDIFKSCHSFTYNMSNRFPKEPVTCVASFGTGDSIFINMHQHYDFGNSSERAKLCYDKSTLKIGHHLVNIGFESLEELILQAELLFQAYSSEERDKSLVRYFSNKPSFKLIKKILFWFKSMFDKSKSELESYPSEVDDSFVKSYLVSQKKIKVINVYP